MRVVAAAAVRGKQRPARIRGYTEHSRGFSEAFLSEPLRRGFCQRPVFRPSNRTSLGLKPSPGTARCAQERGRAQRLAGQGRPRSPRVTEAFPPVSLPGTTLRSSHSFMSAIREVPAPKAIPGHREPPPPDPRVRSLDAPPHSPRHILCEAPSRDGMHCSAMVCVLSNLSQWTVSSAGRVQGYMETQDILKNTGQ
ncbi:unnamed protein product [Rangifer tarandus platyrhynchus]|uniref:Uncharacterized protein n=1 Tax=Rangifer tarandus platyrhynchus TaxID=3082113 RepID=A0AC59Z8S7_RANTA